MSEQEPPDAGAVVQEDLEALRTRAQERDQFLDLLKRTQADFENYQKRNRTEREQERRFAQKPLAQDLLPVIDNLERAVAAARQSNESGPLVQGVVMVLQQFQELLKRHGVTRIEAEGQPFDPNLHMAVAQRPADATHPANTVAQVVEHGYMMHDRVLRPARVIVAMTQ
jgi:molecular chaperone GrpE